MEFPGISIYDLFVILEKKKGRDNATIITFLPCRRVIKIYSAILSIAIITVTIFQLSAVFKQVMYEV
jgi:hypothetical protein